MLETIVVILITLTSLSYLFHPFVQSKSQVKQVDWDN